jgi:hypothetical protein
VAVCDRGAAVYRDTANWHSSGIGDDPQTEARNRPFLEQLQQLGWTDDVNVKIDMRSSSAGDPDSARTYAADLVSLAPDVLVTFGSSSVAALQRITRSIPRRRRRFPRRHFREQNRHRTMPSAFVWPQTVQFILLP